MSKWEDLKEVIYRAITEGEEMGYNFPDSEDYGKYYAYKHIYKYMENADLEEVRKIFRREIK